MKTKTYLGDGVYVQHDERGMVLLTTENGIHATNEIYLEPEVIAAFLAWLKPEPSARSEDIDTSKPVLFDYQTGDMIRNATADEEAASIKAAETDGGAGVIQVDGRSCHVQ